MNTCQDKDKRIHLSTYTEQYGTIFYVKKVFYRLFSYIMGLTVMIPTEPTGILDKCKYENCTGILPSCIPCCLLDDLLL